MCSTECYGLSSIEDQGEKREIRVSWRIQRKFHVGTQTSVEAYKMGGIEWENEEVGGRYSVQVDVEHKGLDSCR